MSPKVAPLTADDLRKNISVRFGLTEKNIPEFTIQFVKAVLNEMTRPATQRMPGNFLHFLKQQNNKKSKTALLASMGYAPKAVPYNEKIHLR